MNDGMISDSLANAPCSHSLETRSTRTFAFTRPRVLASSSPNQMGALVPEEVILKRISEPRSFAAELNATLIVITMYRHESLRVACWREKMKGRGEI